MPSGGISVALSVSNLKQSVNAWAKYLDRAISYAVTHDLGDVIALSYGIGEDCTTPSVLHEMHRIFQAAQSKHITVLAASGDVGALELPCSLSARDFIRGVDLPAADPLVTSVGETTLDADLDGRYRSETAWDHQISSPRVRASSYRLIDVATGGGMSRLFPRPSYQDSIPGIGPHRGAPDVAFDADLSRGVPVVWSVRGQTVVVSGGGTSAGAPAWAGIVALADQYAGRRLGFLNAAIYRIGRATVYPQAFHDVVVGNNTVMVATPRGRPIEVRGFTAGPGWDAVTGWGTPKVATLVPLLAQYAKPHDGSRM